MRIFNIYGQNRNSSPSSKCSNEYKQSFEQAWGLQMISLIMIKNPTIGIAILQQSVSKVAFLLAANDVQNCRSDLIFIRLCLDILFGQQQPYEDRITNYICNVNS